MRHRQFLLFMLPSLLVMLLFIAIPIVSMVWQSLYVEHEQQLQSVESCGPFGCITELRIDTQAMAQRQQAEPMGQFNGLSTYTNATHLAFEQVSNIWISSDNARDALRQIVNLPFYKAMSFTLAYTTIVTPLVIVFGLIVALAVNRIPTLFKGPIIFLSLLPMIITPLIGSLLIYWMIDSRGIIGASLQQLFNDPGLSLKASPTLSWISLFAYGVWHSTPLSFIIFYAGLQTLPRELLESAQMDGSTAWQRLRHIIVPHLMPMALFIVLIQVMDNFRVFEPIIGLSAQANASSLSYLIYSDLRGNEAPLYGSAASTSLLTIAGVILLLIPMLHRSWRDFKRKD